ncbi:RNA-directed DNA polymerase, eukaryota, reverse transcriptase zinc-binding domain protein [Tanacetum coccineum]
MVSIKINVHAWKVKHDCLPTRFNISRRGMEIESILCPMCDNAVESSRHLFFSCRFISELMRKITRWWDMDYMEINSYEDWLEWVSSIRLPLKQKHIFEGSRQRGVGRNKDKISASVVDTKGNDVESLSTPIMIQQPAGMELGPFPSVNEAFGNPNSLAARINDLERQLTDVKLVLPEEDGMPLKPIQVEPPQIRVDASGQDYGTK